jgi:zinc/manganese transport system substrate-binding protein
MSLSRRAFVLVAVCAALAGCGTSASTGGGSGKLRVVAAENFWGSIASQLGGERVQVTSIITSPAADPHDYEPTARDARTLAGARLVIVNGVGYDPWASKLLSANPVAGRQAVTVGSVVGVAAGGNPHRWYSPPDVQRVIDAITASYKQLDPGHDAYYDQQRTSFETHALGEYKRLIAAIKQHYAGVAVGASESIFEPLAQSLGLKLLTPPGFMNAVSEGADPTAADKNTVDRQIAQRQIKVWVYNSQNATPDVKRLTNAARSHGIQVATVTETPTPAGASFQDWQARELQALARSLAAATGR